MKPQLKITTHQNWGAKEPEQEENHEPEINEVVLEKNNKSSTPIFQSEAGGETHREEIVVVESDSIKVNREVIFMEDAPVGEQFDSVLKVFRIMKPNVIELENCEIEDEHLE